MERIRSLDEFDALLRDSDVKPVFLFKHSTRCPISAAAFEQAEQFERNADAAAPPLKAIYVVEDRELSTAAAERLGIKHESPQAILVSAGRAVWHRSHRDIVEAALRGAVALAAPGRV